MAEFVEHGKNTWVHEPDADLEHDKGVYYLTEPEGTRKVAAIFPNDKSVPIETGKNALLITPHKDSWKQVGCFTLKDAMTRGNEILEAKQDVERHKESMIQKVEDWKKKEDLMERVALKRRSVSNDNDRDRSF